MDVLFLSRLQFGLTISFHYIFPPLSIGLGLLLVFMEATYLKTRNPVFLQMTRFWAKVFGLVFAIGVATGIVMEFQFGTNWASYSRFVGDVFGTALAAEGIFAFFLESGFLAVLLFGWDRVGPKTHFFATVMVALGAHFSAVWIVVANSWQQTPAGFHLVGNGASTRAELTDYWAMVLNPSTLTRLSHVFMGAWQAGAFFVLSVGAWYLLRRKHIPFAQASMKTALVLAALASVLQLVTGSESAKVVAAYQPAKLAAIEGHYDSSAPAEIYLFGWPDDAAQKVRFGVGIPGGLSWLLDGDASRPVTGLSSFQADKRPPVNIVFQAYHLMVAIGMGLIGLSWLGLWFWRRGTLFTHRWYLKLLVPSVLGPQAANQLGWLAAEVGRQPYIVYNLLETSQGLSKSVTAGEVLASILMFSAVYLLLFILFIFLLDDKIRQGPARAGSTGRRRA